MNATTKVRRLVTGGASVLVLAAAGFFYGQAILPASGQSEEGEETDHGPPASARMVAKHVDSATGVSFRLMTYREFGGICFDVVATAPNGDSLGGPGRCVKASGQRARARVLVSGGLAVPTRQGSERWVRIAAGTSSCDCQLLVYWADGPSLTVRGRAGYFIGVVAHGAPPEGDARSERAVARVRVSR